MTIKEVENKTGLARSNVRFYGKEKLIEPSRNERNGYREYSEKDVEDIKKLPVFAHWVFLSKRFEILFPDRLRFMRL